MNGIPVESTKGESAADTAQTVSSPARGRRDLKVVTVAYSASVSVDVLVTLNAGAGDAYDTILGRIELSSERYGVYLPEAPIPMADGDAIDVLAPAGGGGITSTVEIRMETS